MRARVVCARAAQFHSARVPRTSGAPAYPLRRFSRRRKNRPTPVHLLERRRRIGRGDHSPLPREAALGQFSGRPIVEAVVRRLADGNQIPAAPLPAWEVVHRIDMVDSGRRLVAAVAAGFTALVAIASQNRIPQMQPAFVLVVHLQSSPFHVSAEDSARRGGPQSPRPVRETTCLSGFRPAQPSEENKKRHDLTTEIMALMPSGYHLGCKTKSAKRSTVHTIGSFGAGAGTKALALAHIHECLPPAQLAVQREVCQRRGRPHALLRRPSAQRADQPAIC